MNTISRRTLLIASALGLTATTGATGCADSPKAGSSGSVNTKGARLHIEKGRFSVDGQQSTAFTDGLLCVRASDDHEKLELGYYDESEAFATQEIGPIEYALTVTGSTPFLGLDGALDTTTVAIDPTASIDALGIGKVRRVSLAGTVKNVYLLGEADLDIEDGAQVGMLTMGSTLGDAAINSNARVKQVKAPFIEQVTGKGFDTATFAAVDRSKAVEDVAQAIDRTRSETQDSTPKKAATFLLPRTAWADEKEADNEGNSDLRATFPPIELPANSPYASLSANEGEDVESEAPLPPAPAEGGTANVLGSLVLEGLEALGEAALAGAIDYTKPTFMEAVFGKHGDSAQIIGKLDEIRNGITEIEHKIDALIRMFTVDEYANIVNHYQWEQAIGADRSIEDLGGLLDEVENHHAADPATLQKQRLKYAKGVIKGKDPKYQADGKTLYNRLADLGKELVSSSTLPSVTVVEAYDVLCTYSYPWEDDAYEPRAQYHDYLTAQFTNLATIYLFCANLYLDAYADKPGDQTVLDVKKSLLSLFGPKSLKEPVADLEIDDADPESRGKQGEVLDLMTANQVIERPESEQRYQEPGCEVTLVSTASVVSTSAEGKKSQRQFMQDSAGHRVLSEKDIARFAKGCGGDLSLRGLLFAERTKEGEDTPTTRISKPEGADDLEYFAVDAPITTSSTQTIVGPGNKTRTTHYFVAVANDRGEVHREEFATSTQENDKTPKWKWREVKAIGVFAVEE